MSKLEVLKFTQWISEGRPVTVYGDGVQKRDFTANGEPGVQTGTPGGRVRDVGRREQGGTVVGVRAQVTYDEGIKRLVEWYQANRAWAKEVTTL